ncbi:MAG: hypothetical protein R3Y26_05865 [Rikenellaceae bacterium]
MKYCYILYVVLLFNCSRNTTTKCNINNHKIDSVYFLTRNIDSSIVHPQALGVFKDYLIIIEPQKQNLIFTVYDNLTFNHVLSAGYKGRSNNEFINPRPDYFHSTDSAFYILDSSIEKEIQIIDKSLVVTNRNPIIITEAINGLIKIGHDNYIMAGLDDAEHKEHLLYNNGDYSTFGKYPNHITDNVYVFNYKLTKGNNNRQILYDFYLYQNLIRTYDFKGNLLQNIEIEDNVNRPICSTFGDMIPVFFSIQSNDEYIATRYNKSQNTNELFASLTTSNHELQLWSWDGNLEKRLIFDKPFNIFTISNNNIIYAINSDTPNTLYYYEIK